MSFIALDVETANPQFSSICSIGIVFFDESGARKKWATLVNPRDYFYHTNIRIHGITEQRVKTQPDFAGVYHELVSMLGSNTIISHGPFDRGAINRAVSKYQLPPLSNAWIDVIKVARRTWPQFKGTGYGLKALANNFGIQFTHHDAAEDALTTGLIFLRAIKDSGIPVSEWVTNSSGPIKRSPSTKADIRRDGNAEGPLYGEHVVFTGALTISRAEAANLAESVGCAVDKNVTKVTTILVVGDQDVDRLADGNTKSEKHRRAEELTLSGQEINIIGQSDFFALIKAVI